MRKIVFAVLAVCLVSSAFAQKDSTIRKILPASKKEAPSNDHFFIQLGYLSWTGKPDSIKTKGLPRSLNMYVMLNFPFKTNPHWSVALGPGIASDNMYFDKMTVGIARTTTTVHFNNVADSNHFKKYKLSTNYLEAPVELRYRFNPDNDRKSVKLAVGAKVGLLINAHVKGTNLQNSSDQTINDYTAKESSKRFLTKQRLSVMGRVGIGSFTLFASYSISPLFQEGLGPAIHPLSIGLNISGL
ncbi:MAG: porin family protein [Flavisolibacter sp.]